MCPSCSSGMSYVPLATGELQFQLMNDFDLCPADPCPFCLLQLPHNAYPGPEQHCLRTWLEQKSEPGADVNPYLKDWVNVTYTWLEHIQKEQQKSKKPVLDMTDHSKQCQTSTKEKEKTPTIVVDDAEVHKGSEAANPSGVIDYGHLPPPPPPPKKAKVANEDAVAMSATQSPSSSSASTVPPPLGVMPGKRTLARGSVGLAPKASGWTPFFFFLFFLFLYV